MPLSSEERNAIEAAFREAMATINTMFHVYAAKAGAPERFAIGVYDATDGGTNYEVAGDPAMRAIAEHEIKTADWGDRNFTQNARNKTRGAVRTGRDSGDLVRNAADLFEEGEMKAPGACLGEVGGKQICVATSGLRGTEDEPFALLTIELMKRILPAP